MALCTTLDAQNIPANAVQLSRSEALEYQRTIIRDWYKESDVFFIKFGRYISTAFTAISTLVLTKHFRVQFKVDDVNKLFTYLPVATTPTVISFLTFDRKVTNHMLVMDMTCPLCLQMKFCCRQMLVGVVYPTVLSALLCSTMALNKHVVEIPEIQTNFKKYLSFVYKCGKAGAMKYKILSAAHIFLALMIPYMQSTELDNISKVLKNENIELM